jgi:hypothetical protein
MFFIIENWTDGSLIWKRVTWLQGRIACVWTLMSCIPHALHSMLPVSQVNKNKNVNGMILRAYTRVKPVSNMWNVGAQLQWVALIMYACCRWIGRVCVSYVTFTALPLCRFQAWASHCSHNMCKFWYWPVITNNFSMIDWVMIFVTFVNLVTCR